MHDVLPAGDDDVVSMHDCGEQRPAGQIHSMERLVDRAALRTHSELDHLGLTVLEHGQAVEAAAPRKAENLVRRHGAR